MTAQSLYGDTPMNEAERFALQLSAVALLVARSDRDVAQGDILLATIFEVLADRPLVKSQIETKVREAWPCLYLTEEMLEETLAIAVGIDHLELDSGTSAYVLLPRGRECLDQSSSAAEARIERFAQQVKDELRARQLTFDAATADALVGTLIEALRRVVADALGSRPDLRVADTSAGYRVTGPVGVAYETWLEDRVQNADRRALIAELLLMALDHSTPVGNEVVHDLVVGHLLYGFMVRPDRVAAKGMAGPLSGQLLILDTPLLLALIGEDSTARPIRNLLARARTLEIKVVLYERTVVELRSLLDGHSSSPDVQETEQALLGGGDPAVLAALKRGDQRVQPWLRWATTRPLGQRTWAQWQAAEGVEPALKLLSAIGVVPSEGTQNSWDFEHSTRTVAFEDELKRRVDERRDRHRTVHAIHHDALNLTEVWRAREASPSAADDLVWPGAFILSPDGMISGVYRAVVGEEALPASLTFSQCASIVGAYSAAIDAEVLAEEIAGGVAEQMLLARAAAIDPVTARAIASAVRAEHVSTEDVYQLRFDVERELQNAADVADPEALAAGAAERLRAGKKRLADDERKGAEDERRRHELAEARNTERAQATLERAERAEKALQDEKSQRAVDDQKTATDRADFGRQLAESNRRWTSGVLIAVVFLAAAWALLVGSWLFGLIALLATVFALAERGPYVRGERSVATWLAIVVGVVAGLAPIVVELLD